MFENSRQAILVSASCTSGWLDWVHGELWMRSDGLLRVRSGWQWRGTKVVVRLVDVSNRPVMEIDDQIIGSMVRAHRTNRWVPKGEINEARFHRGITTSRLSIQRYDGPSVKLLWLRADGGADLLQRWLGARFVGD